MREFYSLIPPKIGEIMEENAQKDEKIASENLPKLTKCEKATLKAYFLNGCNQTEAYRVGFNCQNSSPKTVYKVGSAVIGLKYKGVLKSPNLGLQYQDGQTFTSMKNITKIILQLSFSAGGEVGSSLYKLDKIQKFNPEGLLDVPPLPMDKGFFEVLLDGSYEKDKHYYVVQKEPLPFNINAIIPECNQVIRA